MNQSQPLQSPARQSPQVGVNPFARALAEAERTNYTPQSGQDSVLPAGENPFAQDSYSADTLQQQQFEAIRQQRLEKMRSRLHREINPVDTTALFDARQKQVADQITSLRSELKMLVKEVAHFEKEVEVTLMTQIVEPGQQGNYFLTFFGKLRTWIMLLRQNIKSAQTCLNISKGKAQKRGKTPGIVIGGLAHEKTTSVQDMMHHERSNSYAGS